MGVFQSKLLENQHILLTGATGGIGWETAKSIVAAGGSLTITGRDEEKLTQLKNECETINSEAKILAIAADLTNEQDRKRLVDSAIQSIGAITGLVNSAGIGGGNTIEQLSEDQLRSIMEVNFFSTVFLTQLVYQHMQEQRKGSIVNLSSLSGLRGPKGNGAYSASKFAITGFTHSMALEAIDYNIRVNAVCPGYVDTEMARNSIKRKADENGFTYEDQLQKSKDLIPSKKWIAPSEVANSIIFLLSDAAENIVGESLKISGGSVLR
ncbi:3-oxoacyl-[acyl-carrier protein] reductase [Bacillus ectoiniformans]|uniref:SDR family NAD(P)-dependent oxidoreductase n=1 Tax=Bacillus ectoiniformans TaxID=1494429 RepID=UPI00195A48D0|nr:SDR family oxidoreductase [Bacillus ectoiniformans]MBM7649081.1 3-oxoacyl-[acyl-carrier protein] reductase [Bacillus ectoiniformans]